MDRTVKNRSDDLPELSVVLDADNCAMHKWDGEWYYGGEPLPPVEWDHLGEAADSHWWERPFTVIHVPVTDQEPPVGSIVVDPGGNLWMAGDDGYWKLNGFNIFKRWEQLHHSIARILQWGRT